MTDHPAQTPPTSLARLVGGLLLLQIVLGLLANVVLVAPLFESPGFLAHAAAHPTRVALAALAAIGASGLSVGIAIALFAVLRPHSESLALWLVSLAVAGLCAALVENIHLLSMLSLSQAYAAAGDAHSELFQALRGLAAAPRNWAHIVALTMGGITLVVFYLALYRSRLVPRGLAAFGLAAAVSQLVAVSGPLFGREVAFPLLAPLAASQLALGIWLLARGFRGRAMEHANA